MSPVLCWNLALSILVFYMYLKWLNRFNYYFWYPNGLANTNWQLGCTPESFQWKDRWISKFWGLIPNSHILTNIKCSAERKRNQTSWEKLYKTITCSSFASLHLSKTRTKCYIEKQTGRKDVSENGNRGWKFRTESEFVNCHPIFPAGSK